MAQESPEVLNMLLKGKKVILTQPRHLLQKLDWWVIVDKVDKEGYVWFTKKGPKCEYNERFYMERGLYTQDQVGNTSTTYLFLEDSVEFKRMIIEQFNKLTPFISKIMRSGDFKVKTSGEIQERKSS